MKNFFHRLKNFLTHDVWNTELSSISGIRKLIIRFLRVGHLVIKGFRDDDLPAHAAALTFSTLMAMVPLLAIAFAVLKGLGADQEARIRLTELLVGMPDQFTNFVKQILDIVDRTNFVALGWVGVVVLFVTVVQVLSSVENSFNRVWGAKEPRSWPRKFANYISITVLVPVLIMAAFAISATLQSEAMKHGLNAASPLYRVGVRVAPLASVWLAFFLLIVFIPNTKVRRRPAAASALISAILWVLWQKTYISLQVGVARYNAIYGTFASVPIFLLWLSVCWMIILLGSEIAFAQQNHGTFHMERMAALASMRAKVLMGLSICFDAARGFADGRAQFDVADFAQRHQVSVRLVNDLVGVFVRGGLMARLADRTESFALLCPPDRMVVADIVALMAGAGASPETVGLVNVNPAVEKIMRQYDGALKQTLRETTFAELLNG